MKVRLKSTLAKEQCASAIQHGFSMSHAYEVEYEKVVDRVLCYKLVGGYIYLTDYFEEYHED